MGFQEEISHQRAEQQTHPGRTLRVKRSGESQSKITWGGRARRISAIYARRRRWRITSNSLISDPAARSTHYSFMPARGNQNWKWSEEQTYHSRAPPDPLANFGFPYRVVRSSRCIIRQMVTPHLVEHKKIQDVAQPRSRAGRLCILRVRFL